MSTPTEEERATASTGGVGEVFAAFLPLGLTAFGGPVAHLGFFRTEFVERRRWLSDAAYGDLVALCQFMPGPASSQVGMALGLRRAGLGGLFAAWTAFTLPSAIALTLFALVLGVSGVEAGAGWLLGLKAAAVAVVANALLGMAASLAATRGRATIAAGAAIAILLSPSLVAAQLAAIAVGGLAGLALADVPAGEGSAPPAAPVGKAVGVAALIAFAGGLVVLPLLAGLSPALDLLDRTYRAGALVFGGGHVVLPLLQGEMAGMVDETAFLAGYGAAQAVPGPLFTFAAFLGAVAEPFGGVAGAAVALVGIFLPSLFLVLGVIPFWEELRRARLARRLLAGVNAAVVGLLAAAFYDPVFVRGIGGVAALALAIAAFVALKIWRVPPWLVVVAAAGAGGVLL
ncbi:chromate efflux transporter [Acuticoccus mangrovi]|uniref:Chromate efflux transporter n=1 Tax=Acuticoccus mangrovi TaxID=2796142 RepID=A0A934II12_9HYPH|nr:chromate efflux transporter [Acuticoccus mangrovi]MBJ3775366.1 chromate efflux transporter [Acuticoccus mangrovi]